MVVWALSKNKLGTSLLGILSWVFFVLVNNHPWWTIIISPPPKKKSINQWEATNASFRSLLTFSMLGVVFTHMSSRQTAKMNGCYCPRGQNLIKFLDIIITILVVANLTFSHRSAECRRICFCCALFHESVLFLSRQLFGQWVRLRPSSHRQQLTLEHFLSVVTFI